MRKVTSNVGSSARRTGLPAFDPVSRPPVYRGPVRPCGASCVSSSAMAAPNTTVTFTFDDGRPSQLAAAQQLDNRGMKATFFIISSTVGPARRDVRQRSQHAQGERHGDRRAHRLPPRPADCSRATRRRASSASAATGSWIAASTSTTWPIRTTRPTRAVKQLVAACGYNSARAGGRSSATRRRLRRDRAAARRLLAPHAGRTSRTTTTLAQMKAMVTNAENNGGGWVPLELHDVCDGPNDPLLPAGAPCNAPVRDHARALHPVPRLAQGRGRRRPRAGQDRARGRRRAAAAEDRRRPRPRAHGQPPRQPVLRAGRDERPALELLGQHQQRPGPPALDHDHERRHEGTKALAISVPTLRQLGHEPDRPRARPRAMRAGRAPRSPLHVQRLVQGQRPDQDRRLVAQRRQPVGAARLGGARHESFPLAAAWTKASFTFQAPAGATGVSAGFYLDSASRNHSYTIDDTSLVDESLTSSRSR